MGTDIIRGPVKPWEASRKLAEEAERRAQYEQRLRSEMERGHIGAGYTFKGERSPLIRRRFDLRVAITAILAVILALALWVFVPRLIESQPPGPQPAAQSQSSTTPAQT